VRPFAVVAVFAFAFALPGSSAARGTGGSLVVAGYRLYPAPTRLAAQCRRAQLHVRFTVLCPTLLPRTCEGTTAATACPLPRGDAGIAPTTFAQWANYPADVVARWLYVGGIYGGGETDPVDWASNNPNYFFHFFIDEGALTNSQLDLIGSGSLQRFLGRRTIAGHPGRLFTQRSYSLCTGGCGFTGHLTFIWQQHGITYAASLHRWSANPLDTSVLAILTALIDHLQPV
jgi:hypothetical protein